MMILAERLTKKFDEFTAVNEVSFEVAAGQVLVILGPNGAGKTTTVRMLTSILRPTSGRAAVAGYDVVRDADKVRASVGVLTENHGLYGRMSADEYLDFFGQLYRLDRPTRLSRIEKYLDQFGLSGARQKRLGEFSKGMRQKLALVRALLHEPPVLLLDEPTSAMDPESARVVREAIESLRSADRAIVLCTHNLTEAEELADRVAIIRRGRIVQQGTLPELRALEGPPVFEARLAAPLNGWDGSLPDGAGLLERGDSWLRYRTTAPEQTNPALLGSLLAQNLPVLALQELPHSLEQVYLKVMQRAAGEDNHAG
ncbi:MAG TPA: ABC transporter ATP-binding protein [Anaerolineaceae bacterium]|nr:ABC transporter ATP-binding protein [Anaerolineaceae bacterium]HPN52489.1 ABC transporter ATP-binding protein [Anaerolineaceae bacterium]